MILPALHRVAVREGVQGEFKVILCPKYFMSIKQSPTLCSKMEQQLQSARIHSSYDIIVEKKYQYVHF